MIINKYSIEELTNNVIKDDNKELYELVYALNSIIGIEVTSCYITSNKPYILFKAHKDYSNSLIIIGRIMSRNYGGFQSYLPYLPGVDEYVPNGGWKCEIDYTDNNKLILEGYLLFSIHSGMYTSDVAISQSKEIARNISYHLNHKNFCNSFGIDDMKKLFISNNRDININDIIHND